MSLHDGHGAPEPPEGRTATRWKWAFGGFALLALALLALEHRAHLFGWLPWLILLACPLMHLFMHGRHGGRSDKGGGR